MEFITCTEAAHAEKILSILNEEIINSTGLYDYKPRNMESMAGWFKTKQASNFPVIGAISSSGEFFGFATYGAFRAWPAYKYSIEHSVYIHKDHRGKGVGKALMQRLIAKAVEQQYHIMVGGIDQNNEASVVLHQKLGFSHAGTIKQAGFKFGRWLDLAFYQLILQTPREPVDG
jgi:phosphinothricin acetyltransferase